MRRNKPNETPVRVHWESCHECRDPRVITAKASAKRLPGRDPDCLQTGQAFGCVGPCVTRRKSFGPASGWWLSTKGGRSQAQMRSQKVSANFGRFLCGSSAEIAETIKDVLKKLEPRQLGCGTPDAAPLLVRLTRSWAEDIQASTLQSLNATSPERCNTCAGARVSGNGWRGGRAAD